ncbi:lactonase family protein [Luteococcus peritonei]|uniref:Lactonase family protein n=1 Tax=Luteococcus peritonei TaxID=88874 RepID=A0ABW4RSN0_9ACTN
MSILVSSACASDGTIHTFTLDGEQLTPLATSQVGDGVSAMALDATGRRAWAGTKEPVGIPTLELDAETGVWTSVAHTSTDESMTYLTVSTDQRWLLGASYGGGFGQIWPIVHGRLGEPTSRIEFNNLHCVIELEGFAYFVSLGDDLIACYRISETGVLEPLEVPTVDAPQGSGPRHVVADAEGRNLYCVTEFGGEVIRFSRDPQTGVLTRQEAVTAHATDRGLEHSRIGADPMAEHLIWGADVHLAQGFVLASERTESTISVLPLGEGGSLGEQVSITEVEAQPRAFKLATDERRLLSVGERSEHISLFVLEDDGSLRLADRQPNGQGANWVRLLED